jgi:predicted flap endonuclease-1-like 5' DNA nuclease
LEAALAATVPDWHDGLTVLGTPGSSHRDDLKVIKGIGPKMESILNEFGIVAWEQVAAFAAPEVEKVSNAIKTFPGRIERDQWVGQAAELVERFPDRNDRPTRETYLHRAVENATTNGSHPAD